MYIRLDQEQALERRSPVKVRVTQKSLKEKKSVFVSHKFPTSHLGKLDINKDKSIAMPIVRIILPLLGPRTILKANSLLHMAIVCAWIPFCQSANPMEALGFLSEQKATNKHSALKLKPFAGSVFQNAYALSHGVFHFVRWSLLFYEHSF